MLTPCSGRSRGMRWYCNVFAAAAAALLQACVAAPAIAPERAVPVAARAPVTILISIDGFRPDYLARGVTPVLSGLAAGGVTAAMRPSFPSKTFPNHYAIVTGLRPDRNGIVANRFIDPERPDKTFTMATDDPFYWEQATPIWTAAEAAGIRTATMFWPGSNVAFGDRYPSDWHQFNEAISGRQRVDAVTDWLRRPAQSRPRLVTLYFDAIDTAGHRFGTGAPEVDAALAEVDTLIGRLRSDLETLGQPANLVIVSDHGMADVSADRVIRLDELVARDAFTAIETGPYAGLAAVPGREAEVDAALLRPHEHMECWHREAIPARLHYGTNPRVPPILCLADVGWTIAADPPAPDWPVTGGAHGWDSNAPAMRALFIAHGPAFVAGQRLDSFDNVDIEPLLRTLIGLPLQDGIDGTAARFEPVLADRPASAPLR